MFFPTSDSLSLRVPSACPLPQTKHTISTLLTDEVPPTHSQSNFDFKLFTMDLSYFSGKLEMYLRYKEISFERIELSAAQFETILYHQSGTEQVPQLYDQRLTTLDCHRWLRDTTAIIEHLEQDTFLQKTSLPILPDCPLQRFFHHLFEDYADEFLWRPAMFWRWEPAYDRFIMGHRFYVEFLFSIQSRYALIPFFLRPFFASFRQWLVSCYGEDCTTQEKKQVVIEQYLHLLDLLETILSSQPYLFGNSPTLIDIAFAGPFFRHFSSDFTPRKVMQQRAPAVYEWIARLWNSKSSKFQHLSSQLDTGTGGGHGFPSRGTLPENWCRYLLPLLREYLEYASLNRLAQQTGKMSFDWKNQSEVFHVPMVPYRSWCLMKLQQRYHALDPLTQRQVEAILREHQCWDLFLTGDGEFIASECGTEPPFVVYPPPAQRPYHGPKWDYDAVLVRYLCEVSWRWVLRGLLMGGITLTWKYNH
jgi:glutathione S-transferase